MTATALASEYDSVRSVFDKSLASFTFTVGTGEPVVSIDGYAVTPPDGWSINLDSGAFGTYFTDFGANEFMTHIAIKSQPQDVAVTAKQLYDMRDKIVGGVTNGMSDVKRCSIRK